MTSVRLDNRMRDYFIHGHSKDRDTSFYNYLDISVEQNNWFDIPDIMVQLLVVCAAIQVILFLLLQLCLIFKLNPIFY